jgi:NADH-quinone oxidoreductase subunit M
MFTNTNINKIDYMNYPINDFFFDTFSKNLNFQISLLTNRYNFDFIFIKFNLIELFIFCFLTFNIVHFLFFNKNNLKTQIFFLKKLIDQHLFFFLLFFIFYLNSKIEEENLLNQNFFFKHIDFLNSINSIFCDGISLSFIFLTLFIFLLIYIYIQQKITLEINLYGNIQTNSLKNLNQTLICLFLIEFFTIACFLVTDAILFYIFFEALLFPMYALMIFNGSRERKIRASYLLFMYTIFGSLFLLIGLVGLLYFTGTSDILLMKEILSQIYITNNTFNLNIIWICLFLGFAVKIPMMPFHIWLPEAHVEAPTIGSVILAALLLKLGGYGMLRFCLFLLPQESKYFAFFPIALALTGMLSATFSAISQTDMKRIIAYSSIAHMNIVIFGFFCNQNLLALPAAIYQMISHGLISSALFFLIGHIYEQTHTRNIWYYGGLISKLPNFTALLFFFTCANMGLPFTSAFIGEFLLLTSIFSYNWFAGFIAFLSTIGTSIYGLWMFTRMSGGDYKPIFNDNILKDLTGNNLLIYLILLISVLFFGIYTTPLFQLIESACAVYFN